MQHFNQQVSQGPSAQERTAGLANVPLPQGRTQAQHRKPTKPMTEGTLTQSLNKHSVCRLCAQVWGGTRGESLVGRAGEARASNLGFTSHSR